MNVRAVFVIVIVMFSFVGGAEAANHATTVLVLAGRDVAPDKASNAEAATPAETKLAKARMPSARPREIAALIALAKRNGQPVEAMADRLEAISSKLRNADRNEGVELLALTFASQVSDAELVKRYNRAGAENPRLTNQELVAFVLLTIKDPKGFDGVTTKFKYTQAFAPKFGNKEQLGFIASALESNRPIYEPIAQAKAAGKHHVVKEVADFIKRMDFEPMDPTNHYSPQNPYGFWGLVDIVLNARSRGK